MSLRLPKDRLRNWLVIVPGVPSGERETGADNCNMETEQWQNYGYRLKRKLYDALTNSSDVEEIRDQERKRNELLGIHRSNRPHLYWKQSAVRPRDAVGEKEKACTHYHQLNEYPTLPTPPLLIPLPAKISFHILSWYQFMLVYFVFENFILHIFSYLS